MNTLSVFLRTEREKQGLLLRQVASVLDIDQGLLSRIERGERKATREQIISLAKLYSLNEAQLLTDWLSEKIINELKNEVLAETAIERALEKIRA